MAHTMFDFRFIYVRSIWFFFFFKTENIENFMWWMCIQIQRDLVYFRGFKVQGTDEENDSCVCTKVYEVKHWYMNTTRAVCHIHTRMRSNHGVAWALVHISYFLPSEELSNQHCHRSFDVWWLHCDILPWLMLYH